jgi:hypothetical protein
MSDRQDLARQAAALAAQGVYVGTSSWGLNEQKNEKIGDRQRDMVKKFLQAGLLRRKGAGGRAAVTNCPT